MSGRVQEIIIGYSTSSSDHDLLPLVDIFRPRVFDESVACGLISGKGERICG